MTDLHPDDDLLLALALDDVDDSDRESIPKHLATCQRCRNEYDALSATIEQTLAAAPSVEPSPGFDGRTLTAMGFAENTVSAGQRRTRRRWPLVAASVALGLGLGAGGVLALSGADDPGTETVPTAGSSLWTTDGAQVGTVTPSSVAGRKVLVVTVTAARPGRRYLCLLRLEDGREVESARWVLGAEPSQTWVVDAPAAPVAEVVIVANGGAGPVWSTARL